MYEQLDNLSYGNTFSKIKGVGGLGLTCMILSTIIFLFLCGSNMKLLSKGQDHPCLRCTRVLFSCIITSVAIACLGVTIHFTVEVIPHMRSLVEVARYTDCIDDKYFYFSEETADAATVAAVA